jgi:hypothetical protein
MNTLMTETRPPETAEVTKAIAGGRFRIELADGCVREARLAVAQPVAVGDEVLVIDGANEQVYVIGVLKSSAPRRLMLTEDDALEVFSPRGELVFAHGAGRTRVSIPKGDLELAAPNGTVSIQGRDVEIAADISVGIQSERLHGKIRSVQLQGDRVESVFKTVVSSAENAYWKVTQLARLLTGRMRVRADGSCKVKAESTSIRSEKDTRIDGEHVLLG